MKDKNKWNLKIFSILSFENGISKSFDVDFLICHVYYPSLFFWDVLFVKSLALSIVSCHFLNNDSFISSFLI